MTTVESFRHLYILRPDGSLVWRVGRRAGMVAGFPKHSRRGKHYWMVQSGPTIRTRQVMRSRVVFCLVHGRWPDHEIDHINGNSLDDRPDNLREATRTENVRNVRYRQKASPLPMGIRQLRSGRFFTRIQVDGRRISIGTFNTVESALEAYSAARSHHFGAFA